MASTITTAVRQIDRRKNSKTFYVRVCSRYDAFSIKIPFAMFYSRYVS